MTTTVYVNLLEGKSWKTSCLGSQCWGDANDPFIWRAWPIWVFMLNLKRIKLKSMVSVQLCYWWSRYVYIYICKTMYLYIHIYIHTYICIHVYIYIHISFDPHKNLCFQLPKAFVSLEGWPMNWAWDPAQPNTPRGQWWRTAAEQSAESFLLQQLEYSLVAIRK